MSKSLSNAILVTAFGTHILFSGAATAEIFDIPPADSTALVAAIQTANKNGQDDFINLAPNSTYTLNGDFAPTCPEITRDSLLPSITSEISINGNGSTLIRDSTVGTPSNRIFNVCPDGDLTITHATLAKGRTSGLSEGGGAILNYDGRVSLDQCTLRDNEAFFSIGGAISNIEGRTGITRCTLSNNHASDHGSAIRNRFGSVGVFASSISGNSTNSYGSIFCVGGSVSVEYSTFKDNAGGALGNATAINGETPSIGISNSIIDQSSRNCYADFPIGAHDSIVTDSTCNESGETIIADPMLGPLQNNGGPTLTHALLPGSPALNQGTPYGQPDQRGIHRPSGGLTDRGAYELVHGPGDADANGVIDIHDYEKFLSCYSGPNQGFDETSVCIVFELNNDGFPPGSIDNADFQHLQLLFTDK